MKKKKLIPIADKSNLFREATSNGIINTDDNGYEQYLRSYEARKKEKEEMESLKEKVDSLSSDMSDLKSLMTDFIRSVKNDN